MEDDFYGQGKFLIFASDFAHAEIDIEGEGGSDPGDPGDDNNGDIISRVISKLFNSKVYLEFFFLTRAKYENKRFLAQMDGFSGRVGESIKFNITLSGPSLRRAFHF